MEGSVGKALRVARLEKKLTVEEAARATKIRVARITDLENDEYGKFPNLAYARSFLIMYAKFLGVDISQFRTMEIGSPAGVGDYQYLQNEGGVDTLRFTRPEPVEAPAQNLRWLRFFVIFVVFLVLGSLCAFFYLNLQRLGHVNELVKKGDQEALSAPYLAPTPTPEPSPGVSPGPQPSPVPGSAQSPSPNTSNNPSSVRETPPADVPPLPGAPEVRRAIPVPATPTPAMSAETPAPAAPTPAVPAPTTTPAPAAPTPAEHAGGVPPPAVGEPEIRRAEPADTPLPAQSSAPERPGT